MHPLIDNLNIIKHKLLSTEDGGLCLDLFTLPNDMQIYSASQFSRVICVAISNREMKQIQENAPTRPLSYVANWNLATTVGRVYLDASIVFGLQNVSCIWIHLHRSVMSHTQFESLINKLYNRCADNATLYIVCVDGDIALQYAKSHLIYIDKERNMHMQYHKQPIDMIPVASVVQTCEENGFFKTNSINGEEVLRISGVNCLPYDRWTSQTFFLLQFKSKSHFRQYA